MEPTSANTTSAAFISSAPTSLTAWIQALDQRDLPVLQESARLIDEYRDVEDDVDAHMIAEGIGDDPLMTLKLLRHVARLKRPAGREHTDAETAVEALVMLGITPFFRDFGTQAAVEVRLASHPRALHGLHNVLWRSRRAARFALAFAIHRQDHDAAVIHEAALLHDFAEMLLWVHAPSLALEIAARQHHEPTLRSVDAQREVLHVPLADVQQGLLKTWRLPQLLVRITDDHATELAQVRNVQLAVRVARHSAHGWDNPALPDDVDELAELLNLGTAPTWTLLRDLDP